MKRDNRKSLPISTTIENDSEIDKKQFQIVRPVTESVPLRFNREAIKTSNNYHLI